MSSNKVMLNIEQLKLRRSDYFALNINDLKLAAKTSTCVVGANGSGKTTLVELITGLLAPNSGIVTICGQTANAKNLRLPDLLGFIPDDENWLINELTAQEYINTIASVRSQDTRKIIKTAQSIAEQLMFKDFDQPLQNLSHGNKKKVQIIVGLMHNPKLLIVDELRNGLDPIAITRAEQLLQKCRKAGTTILATSHDLWWAERFSTNIVMLKDGNVCVSAKTKDVVQKYGSLENKFMELYNG